MLCNYLNADISICMDCSEEVVLSYLVLKLGAITASRQKENLTSQLVDQNHN